MVYNPEIHNRKSLRLKDYDYARQGAYFITIVINNRDCVLGEIENDDVILSDAGKLVWEIWGLIPQQYSNVIIDEFIIMPDHVHGIIIFEEKMQEYKKDALNRLKGDAINRRPYDGGGITGDKNPMLYNNSLSAIVRWFKGRCSFEIRNKMIKEDFKWQGRFYEHVIRNEEELMRIRTYIKNNPLRWGQAQKGGKEVEV